MRQAWVLVAALAIGWAGCDSDKGGGATSTQPAGGQGPSAGRPVLLKIAVVPKCMTRLFWKAIHAGAVKAELELEGVQILWKGPYNEGDRKVQIDTLENFINVGVHGIVLAPADRRAMVPMVREATKAGIPVVIMDSDLDAKVGKDYVSFVATDNRVGGVKAARHLGKILGGKGNVLLMRYMVGSASTHAREEGFLATLKKEFPDIQIVSSDQYAGDTQEKAIAKAESLLNRFPELDGIFCPNDSSAFGMLRALHESGRAGKVKFVAFDAIPKLVEAMEKNEIQGLVVQDPVNMAYVAVKTVVAHIRGEKVEPRIDTGSEVITPENMNEPRMKELLEPPVKKYLDE